MIFYQKFWKRKANDFYKSEGQSPPPEDLIKEGEELTKQLFAIAPEERKDFIEINARYWSKLQGHLRELSNGKCWYTEAKDIASHYHVDHFRPKNETKKLVKNCTIKSTNNDEPYWWLAFDWENYKLSTSLSSIKMSSRSCSLRNLRRLTYFSVMRGQN